MGVVVFLTVNTNRENQILARPDVHELICSAWAAADDWLVGRYVIMPEHIHLLCSPRDMDSQLHRWIQYWKSFVSRRWPRPAEKPIFQRDYWDTQLRPNEDYNEKWEYMRLNPVRRGLVTDPDDWPFAGQIHALEAPDS
jgi:putative transposase